MINEGTTERYHRLSDVTLGNDMSGSMGIINIFRAQPRTMPMNITMMERHPLGSQAFLPTNGLPYLVLVCLGKDAPDPDTLKLFIADGSGPSLQGVSYKANCWHHPLLALDQVTDFWVVDRLGSGNNLEEMDFDSTMNITIDRK
jgi:ureidoglycolate lyase